MSYMDDIDDIFGVGILEEIPIDEEEEAKKYMLTMYERLNRLRDKHELEEEVIRSSESSGTSSSIVFSDDSVNEEESDVMHIHAFLTVNRNVHYEVVPVLKAVSMRQWNTVVHHERRIKDVMYKLGRIKDQRQLVLAIRKAGQLDQYEGLIKTKNKIQKHLATRTLAVCAMERIAFEAIGNIAFNLKDIECMIDSTTNGVWINSPEKQEAKSFIADMGTNRMVLTRRFQFNSRQTDNLVLLMFSTEPDKGAHAKLDLNASLAQDVFKEVVQYPGRTLEIVCVEAMLTRKEVLYLVFPLRRL